MAKSPSFLTSIVSGSADGELRMWDLTERKSAWMVRGHDKFVRGVCFIPEERKILSCGDDKIIKLWDCHSSSTMPILTFNGKSTFTGVDHHRNQACFATSGAGIEIWNHERTEPVTTFSWNSDTITSVKFNQTEISILAACAYDRSVILYDLRSSTPLAKSILNMRSNALCWNPMEAYYFTVANEDHNCYTFDMRKMDRAVNIIKGHVSAVLDVDYSPTGQEIVTGSYDKTVRIFNAREGLSRDVYHTKRMQRIFTVKVSMDAQYILSGSDEGNIRLWKMDASRKIAIATPREKAAVHYNKALKQKFRHVDEVRKISRHRRIPKAIVTATKTKREMLKSAHRKAENERKHSKFEGEKKSEKEKTILAIKK